MFRCDLFLYLTLIEIMNACIPTQNIETCSTCSKIYNTGCQGYGIPSASDWCVIGDDIPVTYTLESAFDYAYGEDACTSVLSCPSGTISYFLTDGIDVPGNDLGTSPTTVYCAETGSYAGEWNVYTDYHGYPITQMTCRSQ
ncbi:hypothetical protein CAEBREN_07056 [Caenorhabditis brenneri]|uniref:C6 domain-containing protein n=1 Tax=Caenorhabditis brenneri TaxID=135651 RepID=G0MPT4_CAEBE|nr:hypothetical protein CAEBREN_07056 [Caenorhabditis brenneri]